MPLKYRNQKNAEAIASFWNKPLSKPDWFEIQAKKDDETEIYIYDVVGWPFIEAKDFVRALDEVKAKKIIVRINSPGGDVFDGTAIFNSLRNHPAQIITRIEGIAASIASILALAGDEVQAFENTMMMIHNAWVIAIGDQNDLRETADVLEKIDSNFVDIYYNKSKLGKKQIRQMMHDETWFTAKEAKEKDFIDTLLDDNGEPIQAKFDLSMFNHVPENLSGNGDQGKELTTREVERALREAGASRTFAKTYISERSEILREAEIMAALEKLKLIFER
ncbi:MAG TPA: head maturation protease, ClpP-related [Desulfobacterales bacterium]|nr:head maturation protease, ClpP-related [Desulfobacterales bacterium]